MMMKMTDNDTENNMIRNRMIFLDRIIDSDIWEEHRFSLSYRLKKRKLLRRWKKLYVLQSECSYAPADSFSKSHKICLRKRLQLVLIIIILSSISLMVMTGFQSQKFNAYGLMVDDTGNKVAVTYENAAYSFPDCYSEPDDVIYDDALYIPGKTRYDIVKIPDADKAHYESYLYVRQDKYCGDIFDARYKSIDTENKYFGFFQINKDCPGMLYFDNKHAAIRPHEIKVGDYGGMYYHSNLPEEDFKVNDTYVLVEGDYVMVFEFYGFTVTVEEEEIILDVRFGK